MRNERRFFVFLTNTVAFLFLVAGALSAGEDASRDAEGQPSFSASGGCSIIPFDSWLSGNFSQFMSVVNPSSPGELKKLLDIHMDATATTIYEGDLFFRKIGLSFGLKVDVDDNFIGKFNRFLGYVGYDDYSIRVQTSRLRGTLDWHGSVAGGLVPSSASFDNRFYTVDLLYYPASPGSQFYFGIGYTSYELPTQLECLVVNSAGEIVYGNQAYQPDMRFRIYSFLFGFDTLRSSFMGVDSFMNSGDGLGLWIATQDRFGGGVSRISDEARTWIEALNPGRSLYDRDQIVMMVDYLFTLGVRWTGGLGPARLGLGLGYNVGGQVIMGMSSKFKAISETDQVDASPNLYLAHHGVIFRLSASW